MVEEQIPITREKELLSIIDELSSQLHEAEELINAIHRGEVDAFLVSTDSGEMIYTLEGADRVYRQIIEQMREGSALLSKEGIILYCNASLARILQIPPEQIIGQFIMSFISPAEHDRFGEFLTLGKSDGELGLLGKKDHYIPVHISINQMLLDEMMVFSTVVTDLTEQKRAEDALRKAYDQLEDRVKERTAELNLSNIRLKQSNKDLEQFAYVASHDLQEPLRTIVGFSQLLKRRYGNMLGKDADEYIEFIVDAGKRMQAQIQDLLQYSRVSTKGKKMTWVKSGAVLEDAINYMQRSINRSGAIITHDQLPVVLADASQLEQVFQNFLSNAIKFSKVGILPEIHVSAKSLGDRWQFSVKDNGIGIEPQYFDRIFIIFQRLHTNKEIAGTGIGLAICKRIIERHGGEIWAESEPMEGSTFYFTLPAVPDMIRPIKSGKTLSESPENQDKSDI
jgi:PAS domain S-box-containing protein